MESLPVISRQGLEVHRLGLTMVRVTIAALADSPGVDHVVPVGAVTGHLKTGEIHKGLTPSMRKSLKSGFGARANRSMSKEQKTPT